MDEQRLEDQLELINNSSVPIQDVPWKTCRERWTIEMGGERGSRKSEQETKYDDDTIYQPLRSGRIWHKVNF